VGQYIFFNNFIIIIILILILKLRVNLKFHKKVGGINFFLSLLTFKIGMGPIESNKKFQG
jgi:hypothetical protein